MPQWIMRKIYLVGEINDTMFLDFVRQLDQLEAQSNEPVHIDICSHGGEAPAGLAIYGRIRASSCLVYTTAYGQCQSAATIILAGSDYRSSALDCWSMVHDSPKMKKASVAEKQQHEREEQQWADILALHTQLPASEWRKLSKKTTYLTPAEMLQYGLIDRILKGSKNA